MILIGHAHSRSSTYALPINILKDSDYDTIIKNECYNAHLKAELAQTVMRERVVVHLASQGQISRKYSVFCAIDINMGNFVRCSVLFDW